METEELEALLRCHPKATEIVQQTLHELQSEAKVSFDIEPLPDDFRLLEPSTNLWSRYWKANPKKQNAMLEWKELLDGGLFTHA